MDRKIGLGIAFAVGLGIAAPALAQQTGNLVTNGSFEGNSPSEPPCGYYCPGSCSIADWQAGPIDFFPCSSDSGCPDGNHIIELNQCTPGWIQQEVPLVAGTSYQLRFLHGVPRAHCGNSPRIRESRVSVGGAEWEFATEPDPDLPELVFRWYTFEVDFTATPGQSMLRFESLNPGCSGAWIDAISITEHPTCPADLTGDGQVNGGDLSIVLGFWGTPAKTLPAADLNGDGTVNAQDLSMLLGSWGPCPN